MVHFLLLILFCIDGINCIRLSSRNLRSKVTVALIALSAYSIIPRVEAPEIPSDGTTTM